MSNPAAERILPCPFCGSRDVDPEGWMSSDKRTGPACDECGGSTETVERWNTRPGHDVLLKALEEIEQTPACMANDSESLRHTIKSIHHVARAALALAKSGAA